METRNAGAIVIWTARCSSLHVVTTNWTLGLRWVGRDIFISCSLDVWRLEEGLS